ncbi:MAG: hypothetical protein QOC64_2915 [Solirubrobacteraceae bacterium]|nr:hypothetical protein [Solirubrobacteraceae bacterium]
MRPARCPVSGGSGAPEHGCGQPNPPPVRALTAPGVAAWRREYRRVMFDVSLVSGLAVLVAWVARRAVRGAPPRGPVRFAIIAAVSAAIQLGFHAAATAAPTLLSVIALVLTGWTGFILWMVWLSRAPAGRSGESPEDDAGGGGGGGGRGPHDDGPPRGDPPSGGDESDIDWERFERDLGEYIASRERRELTPG